MTNDINLLQNDSVSISATLAKRIKIVHNIAIFCLFIIPTTAVVFTLMIFFSPLSSIDQQKNSLIASNTSLLQKAGKIAYINDRMAGANTYLTKRNMYDKVTGALIDALTGDVILSELQINTNGEVLIVDSSSLESLKTYQANLASIIQKQNLNNKITFQNIDLKESGYELSLNLK